MSTLHFVLFPLMAQGHMIPMVDIARLLAQRGASVTIITTPLNANRFKSVINRAIKAKLKIQLFELKLPLTNFGLPEGCESFDLIPSAPLFRNLFDAASMLKEPAEKMIQVLIPPPSCVISDNLFSWTYDIARKFNIPRLIFYGPGCFTYLCRHITMHTNFLDEIVSDSKYFVLPGIPDRIELTKVQASSSVNKKEKEITEFRKTLLEAEEASNGIVVNSFEELEPFYVEGLAKAKGKKVWCIGPVSLCNKSLQDLAERGSKAAINENECLKWLDSKEKGSVMFVCLGSLTRASTEQNFELALGLKASNVPFIWCLRHQTDEFDRWLVENRYEEKVKDRGIIVRGWAPQVMILSHQAVGGFLTHCGWNSTLEGISSGVPMVTWPQFADQFLNERFIVDVLKIGVKVGIEVPILVGEQDKLGALVKNEDVKIAIEGLMSKEEEGEARRNRARDLAEMAKTSMEEGGSSHVNMTSMIQNINELLDMKSTTMEDGIVKEF